MTHTLAGFPEFSQYHRCSGRNEGGSYSSTHQLWSAICNKVSECTEHRADQNPSSAVPGPWPHTVRRSTQLLQEFGWEVFNHHPPYSPIFAHSIFHLFLRLKKFLSGERRRSQNDREAEKSVTLQWSQSQAADFYDTGYESCSYGMTNVSIPEVNMLKSSSTLAVSVPINLSIKLVFVSVNGINETYFVDGLRF